MGVYSAVAGGQAKGGMGRSSTRTCRVVVLCRVVVVVTRVDGILSDWDAGKVSKPGSAVRSTSQPARVATAIHTPAHSTPHSRFHPAGPANNLHCSNSRSTTSQHLPRYPCTLALTNMHNPCYATSPPTFSPPRVEVDHLHPEPNQSRPGEHVQNDSDECGVLREPSAHATPKQLKHGSHLDRSMSTEVGLFGE